MVDFSRISRIELWLLFALLLIGFAFRVWNISSVGLDHFDEGVYMFSALGLSDGNQPNRFYPQQVKFSPPVFFGLVGLTNYALGKVSDRTAFLLNAVLGTLTVALLWWIARSWFGPQTAIAAAALLTFSEFHIALSRSALTDVSFGFFFILALAFIVTALRRQSIGFSVVAGLMVGLAWNTKYHGWFALVMAGAALLPFAWYRSAAGVSERRSFILWGIMAVVAAACYLPWAFFIQSQPGGYAALVKYHGRFMHDFQWIGNLWRQAQMQLFLEGPLSRSSVLLAFFCVLLVSHQRLRHTSRFLLTLALISACSLSIGGAGTAVLLTLLAIPVLLRHPSSFTAWLVLSWLALWFFATPLYRPYARLVLPLSIATYIVAGLWLSATGNQPQNKDKSFAWQPTLTAVAALVVGAISMYMPDPSDPWKTSRSVPEAAVAMENIIPPGSRVIVIGEPSLAFYLHLANRPAFERTEDPAVLERLDMPVFVVTGRYARVGPSVREGLEKLGDRLVLLGTFPMAPKDVRVLDDFVPEQARHFHVNPGHNYDLTLYRLLPKGKES